jgi:hypothetical protein
MGGNRKGKNQQQHHVSQKQHAIDNPHKEFPIRIEPDAKCKEKCRDEKESRDAQLCTAKLLNLITAIGVLAAVIYAAITWFQWRDLRHNFMVDERAWLKTQISFPPTLQGSKVLMKFVNIGKSVATNAHYDAALQLVDSRNAPSFDLEKWHTLGTFQVMFPNNAENPIPISRFRPNGQEILLTETEKNDLAVGNLYAVVFGDVVYADQFGQHWARFCYSYHYNNEPSTFSKFNDKACSDYNAVGDSIDVGSLIFWTLIETLNR